MKKISSLIVVLLISVASIAQILEPVTWSFSKKDLGNQEYELIFTATIDQQWHLYSQKIEMQPPATLFVFDENPAVELIGIVVETESEEKFDPNFDMMIRYFSDEAIFTQKVKIKKGSSAVIKGYIEFMSCDDMRCLPPSEQEFKFQLGEVKKEVAAEKPVESKSTDNESDSSLIAFFFIAFAAGLLGLLTPCVYPMIPMTVTFFMNSSGGSKVKARINALVFGFSIIAIYTLIGVLVTVLFGADAIKNVSAHWITNSVFFLLFAFFAASFFGMFELVLPASLTNKSDKQVDKGGVIGAFFMALTLVLVSFSCTAPFVGGILVEAATGSLLQPIVGMFGFSLAFAILFTFLAFFPSLLSKLPQSGGWLNSVKVVLGFVILALGTKFLLVPNQVLGWDLSREFFIALWIVLFTLMGLYLLGKIKFSHDSPVNHISVPRLALIIATFTFVIYLLPGLIGAPLKAVSGFLPTESSFNLVEMIGKNAGSGPAVTVKSEICEEPKHADKFKLPHGLQGYFDYEQGMACARKLNKPVLLDFKGHFCTNCKVMEKNVWSDPEVLKRLSEDYVIIALYSDDNTELPEEEWITVDGRVKKTIGKINTAFQIEKYGLNAQPYYVLVDHDGNNLNEARAFDLDIDEFVNWLDEGKAEFAKR
ncbi:MAG: disulfide bond formation protein DsbD [Bacteroidetes bacterium]|nr:disulfide bond formation protein DsbD [Bacteroidota bacterium]